MAAAFKISSLALSLGGLSVPIDNVHHTPSNGLKRARSFMLRAPQHPTVYVPAVNYQPTDPYAASPEGRWHHDFAAQVCALA